MSAQAVYRTLSFYHFPFFFKAIQPVLEGKCQVNNPEIYHYHVLSSSLGMVKVDTCLKNILYTILQDTGVLVLAVVLVLSQTDSPNSG